MMNTEIKVTPHFPYNVLMFLVSITLIFESCKAREVSQLQDSVIFAPKESSSGNFAYYVYSKPDPVTDKDLTPRYRIYIHPCKEKVLAESLPENFKERCLENSAAEYDLGHLLKNLDAEIKFIT